MEFPTSYFKLIEACITTPMLSVSFNGGLCGYFSASKGLRHGDPLSPYLFTVAMEYFSCLIHWAAIDNQVPYHSRCKELRITHLCFADDLLVFTNGSIRGVAGINRVLTQFYKDSGLRCNPSKCELFCCGTPDEEQQWISAYTGFPLGSLPVRYLGVPLISGKLTSADCSVLVDKITARIRTWQAKKLSYAGRLQLVSSVITSIMQYWMALFLLPQKLLKEIENICNQFLWGVGNRSLRKKALVAWKYVAWPRNEGGLGIRDFKKWNQACVIRHVWNLLAESGSLWVRPGPYGISQGSQQGLGYGGRF
ncbi:unnamed protein product [Linum trigynum]|uniref:Reverse transcriptase domain-containing protein n=1 Tax=Linum trigynum TaxID=586398 RepID=A0AAV2DAV7_9ROSI